MFSSLRVMGILSQMVHAAYPIVCFLVLVRTFFKYVFFSFFTFLSSYLSNWSGGIAWSSTYI